MFCALMLISVIMIGLLPVRTDALAATGKTAATKVVLYYRPAGENVPEGKNAAKDKGFAEARTLELPKASKNVKATWKSSNEKVAKVSKAGKVTPVKAGTATITADCSGKKYKYKITVKKAGFSLGKTTNLSVGEKIRLKVNGDTVKSFSSSKEAVAKVTSTGKLTAKKAGKAVITAKCEKGTYTIKITVDKNAASLPEKKGVKIKYKLVQSGLKHRDKAGSWGEENEYFYYGSKWSSNMQFNYVDAGPEEYVECCDYDGKYLSSFEVGYDGYPHTVFYGEIKGSDVVVMTTRVESHQETNGWAGFIINDGCIIEVHDKLGNVLVNKLITPETEPKIKAENWKAYDPDEGCMYVTGIFGKYLEISFGSYMDGEAKGVYGYLDMETGDVYASGTVKLPKQLYPDYTYSISDYDMTKFGYLEKTPIEGVLFFGSADRSSWGFMNSKYEVIARFSDASNFSGNGYALVSDDRKTYYFIDKDFNIYRDYTFEGNGASIAAGGMTFKITKEDGTLYAVHME